MKLKIKPRLYQEEIFGKAVNENTLVVLPTGLGKTLIALMMALYHLPKGNVLVLAPTKPLVEQHLKSFVANSDLKEEDCALVTGAVRPEERSQMYLKKIVFATPQTIRNDIIAGRINLNNFSLIVFDESHKAVGNYAYCFIASQFNGRKLGLSASPGTDAESIKQVCNNLNLTRIEWRTEKDPDVRPYLKSKRINYINLELPDEFREIIRLLKRSLSSCLKELKERGFIETHDINKVFKRDLLKLQQQAVKDKAYVALSLNAKALKVMHALELLQTQGIDSLKKYFEGLKNQKAKATRQLLRDVDFQQAMHLAFKTKEEHPKYKALLDILKPGKTYLIFTQYRATAEQITKLVGDGARLFVGQRGVNGMSQKEQLEILNSFRNGEFNILVSTSISEEGLDIPKIDTAIFFEPVPSALRTVQRKGRVGRAKAGEIFVLVTKGTVDEKYKWVAYYKEKKMKEAIKNLSRKDLVQSSLESYL